MGTADSTRRSARRGALQAPGRAASCNERCPPGRGGSAPPERSSPAGLEGAGGSVVGDRAGDALRQRHLGLVAELLTGLGQGLGVGSLDPVEILVGSGHRGLGRCDLAGIARCVGEHGLLQKALRLGRRREPHRPGRHLQPVPLQGPRGSRNGRDGRGDEGDRHARELGELCHGRRC